MTTEGGQETVTNTTSQSPTGSLTITKDVAGAPDGWTGTFTFSVTCTDPAFSATGVTIDTASGDTATVSGIPLNDGTNSCTVAETGSGNPPTGYTAWSTTYSTEGGVVTMTTEGGQETVTNSTSQIPPGQGYFQFSKTVGGNLTGWTGGPFSFTVTCGDTEGTPVTLTVGSSGGSVSSQTFGPYDAGTVCTVTEDSLPAAGTYASWVSSPTYSPTSGSQTIVSDTTVSVAVTNTRTYSPPPPPPPPSLGNFQFTKTVGGNLTGWAGGQFPFTVTCGGSSTPVTLTLGASGSTVSSPVFGPYAPGTVCSVTEGSLPAAGTDASWVSSPSYSPTSGSATIVSGQTVSVAVTNTRTYSPPPPSPARSPSGGVAGATGTPSLPPTTSLPGQGGGPNGTILLLLGALGAASLALITTTLLRERLLERVDR